MKVVLRSLVSKIYSVGDDVDFCTEGDYVLVAHGRWSRGVEIGPDEKVWLLDNKDCLMQLAMNLMIILDNDGNGVEYKMGIQSRKYNY